MVLMLRLLPQPETKHCCGTHLWCSPPDDQQWCIVKLCLWRSWEGWGREWGFFSPCINDTNQMKTLIVFLEVEYWTAGWLNWCPWIARYWGPQISEDWSICLYNQSRCSVNLRTITPWCGVDLPALVDSNWVIRMTCTSMGCRYVSLPSLYEECGTCGSQQCDLGITSQGQRPDQLTEKVGLGLLPCLVVHAAVREVLQDIQVGFFTVLTELGLSQ